MTVRVAISDQSQSLTRSLTGSTAGSRGHGSASSFGGVLSTVADGHAASGQAAGTTVKDGTGKKTASNVAPTPTPGNTSSTANLDPSLSASSAATLFPVVALASDTAAAGTTSTKGKGRHVDGDKGETQDSGSSTAQASPDATSAGGSQQVSLLALLQSAAAMSSGSASEASATAAAATSPATTGAALSASSDPKDVSTPSLISDVSFQTYLSPVIASGARGGGGKQTSGSVDPANAPSSSKDGSSTEATTSAPGASPTFGAATATGSDAPASDQGQADTPSGNASTQTMESRSGHGSADVAASASDKAASSVAAAASVSPAIDVSAVVSGATLSAPLQSVAEAVVSLAAQPTGSAQTSGDSASRVSPARTMLLQLNPGDLGTVSVRLHLTGSTLDVSLSASKDQTAALLDQGRDTLTRAISDQNYQINSLVIQRGDATSLSGSSNATSDTSRDQGASYSGGGDASGSGSRQGADGSPARQDRQSSPSRPTPGTRGAGLFL